MSASYQELSSLVGRLRLKLKKDLESLNKLKESIPSLEKEIKGYEKFLNKDKIKDTEKTALKSQVTKLKNQLDIEKETIVKKDDLITLLGREKTEAENKVKHALADKFELEKSQNSNVFEVTKKLKNSEESLLLKEQVISELTKNGKNNEEESKQLRTELKDTKNELGKALSQIERHDESILKEIDKANKENSKIVKDKDKEIIKLTEDLNKINLELEKKAVEAEVKERVEEIVEPKEIIEPIQEEIPKESV